MDGYSINRAINFAAAKHKGQTYGDLPYLVHCMHVMYKAKEWGYNDTIVIACILHDTLEDTYTTITELIDNFGSDVADIVYRVSNESGYTRAERNAKTYDKIANNKNATIVKMCDRYCNLLSSITNNVPNKLEKYLNEHDEFIRQIPYIDTRAYNEYLMLIKHFNKHEKAV